MSAETYQSHTPASEVAPDVPELLQRDPVEWLAEVYDVEEYRRIRDDVSLDVTDEMIAMQRQQGILGDDDIDDLESFGRMRQISIAKIDEISPEIMTHALEVLNSQWKQLQKQSSIVAELWLTEPFHDKTVDEYESDLFGPSGVYLEACEKFRQNRQSYGAKYDEIKIAYEQLLEASKEINTILQFYNRKSRRVRATPIVTQEQVVGQKDIDWKGFAGLMEEIE